MSKASLPIRRFYTSLLFARPASFWKQDRKADQSLLGSSFFVLSAITVSCLSHLQRPSGLKKKRTRAAPPALRQGSPSRAASGRLPPLPMIRRPPSKAPLMLLGASKDSLMLLCTALPTRPTLVSETGRKVGPGNSFRGLQFLCLLCTYCPRLLPAADLWRDPAEEPLLASSLFSIF